MGKSPYANMGYPMLNFSSVQGAEFHRETRTGAQHANGVWPPTSMMPTRSPHGCGKPILTISLQIF